MFERARRLTFSRLAALAGAALLIPQGARATESSPTPVLTRYQLEQAVQILVTPSGQKRLGGDLVDLLKRFSVQPENLKIEHLEYSYSRAFSPETLPEDHRHFAASFDQIRHALSEWALGLHLEWPRPRLEIDGLHLQARFNRAVLRIDDKFNPQSQTQSAKPYSQVPFVLEVEVPELSVSAKILKATDLENPLLGEMSVRDTRLYLAKGSRALKVKWPLLIGLDQGRIRIEAGGATNNLSQVKLQASFKRPLKLPKVQLQIGDQVSTLDWSNAEEQLVATVPALVNALQDYTKEWAEKQLPTKIQEWMLLNYSLEQRLEISALGQDRFPAHPLVLGFSPDKLSQTPAGILAEVTASIDDSLREPDPRPVRVPSRPLLQLAQKTNTDFDAAIAIRLALLNRMVRFSYDRGNWGEFKTDSGMVVKLTRAPRILPHPQNRNQLKMELGIQVDPKTLKEKAAFSGPISIEIELDAEFRTTGMHSLSLVGTAISEQKFRVDDETLRHNGLKSTVDEVVRSKLSEINKEWLKKPLEIAGQIDLPVDWQGIPVHVVGVDIDAQGFIVLKVRLGHD